MSDKKKTGPDKKKTSKKKKSSKKPDFPTREQVVAFIENATEKVGKREIARAFNIKGSGRIKLKELLADLRADGLLGGSKRHLRRKGHLPPVSVVEVSGRDDDGEYYAVPENWDAEEDGPTPRLLIVEKASTSGRPKAVGIGDRVLARIAQTDGDPDYSHTAEPIRTIGKRSERLLGIYREHGDHGNGVIDPVDRKQLKSWSIKGEHKGDAKNGDLVTFTLSQKGRYGLATAQVEEVLGNPDDDRQISLIAIHRHDIPNQFPDTLLPELAALEPPTLKGREDFREIPLITIDPADARDHDDAVWAEADDDPKNEGGYVVIVAIADVAHYVRAGMALDREAQKRGNSVYFPDRVVPMLPEVISNDLCSLREHEERPCLAARMVFNKDGQKLEHSFHRALMRSHAKLSYQEAQAAIDGEATEKTEPLLEPILKPLWGAYGVMMKGRERRAPLELDLPERKIVMSETGEVSNVIVPGRLDAHKLIEEMMIQANVAAAEALEAQKMRLIYRTHDAPMREKLQALSEFLETIDISFAANTNPRPKRFNEVLARTADSDNAELVSEVILRSQSQAEYVTENYGHFGLNLRRYAHFTSPIRRYADLIVHRALIAGLKFGKDGLTDGQSDTLDDIAEHISMTERRAMMAERETVDRLIASHLANNLQARFVGRIAGVTKSGLFVKLEDSGADGYIPASTMGNDYYVYVEEHRALVGERTGEAFRLGDTVEVKLVEAIPSAGALRFEMLSDGTKGVVPKPSGRGRPERGRPRRGGPASAYKSKGKGGKRPGKKAGGRAPRKKR